MLVPLRSPTNEIVEWGLLELQGTFVKSEGCEDYKGIGTLTYTNQDKSVLQLTIGYHQLEGKRIPLKKPILLMEKHTDATKDMAPELNAIYMDEIDKKHSVMHTSYEVIGVLRHKYLFKTRPRALITKPQPTPS